LSVEALDAGLILFSLVLVNFVSYGGESIGVLDPGHYEIRLSIIVRRTIFIREHTRDTLSPDFSSDLLDVLDGSNSAWWEKLRSINPFNKLELDDCLGTRTFEQSDGNAPIRSLNAIRWIGAQGTCLLLGCRMAMTRSRYVPSGRPPFLSYDPDTWCATVQRPIKEQKDESLWRVTILGRSKS